MKEGKLKYLYKQAKAEDLFLLLITGWYLMIELDIENIFKISDNEIRKKELKSRKIENLNEKILKGKKYKVLESIFLKYKKNFKKGFFLEKYKMIFGTYPDSKIRNFFLKKNISKETFKEFLYFLENSTNFNKEAYIFNYLEERFENFYNFEKKYFDDLEKKGENLKYFYDKKLKKVINSFDFEENKQKIYFPIGYKNKKKELFVFYRTIWNIYAEMLSGNYTEENNEENDFSVHILSKESKLLYQKEGFYEKFRERPYTIL